MCIRDSVGTAQMRRPAGLRLPQRGEQHIGVAYQPRIALSDPAMEQMAARDPHASRRRLREAAGAEQPQVGAADVDGDRPCLGIGRRSKRDAPMVEQRGEQTRHRRIARVAQRVARRPARKRIGEDHRAPAAAHKGVDRDKIARCKRGGMREQQGIAARGRVVGKTCLLYTSRCV